MHYGVVPSGGLGVRALLPHSKELALVGGRPVIEYILDRLVLAGLHQIYVTTCADKRDLIDYLTHRSPHRHLLKQVIGQRLGLFDGIISPAQDLSSTDELYFGLPDTLWYPEDGFAKLLSYPGDVVLGVLPSETPELFGSVVVSGQRALSLTEKPSRPTSPWIWAFGKIMVRAIPKLREFSHQDPGFTNILGAYAQHYRVQTAAFAKGKYFDTGTPAGLLAANQYVAS